MVVDEPGRDVDNVVGLPAKPPGPALTGVDVESIEEALESKIFEHAEDERALGWRYFGTGTINPERSRDQRVLVEPATVIRPQVGVSFVGLILRDEVAQQEHLQTPDGVTQACLLNALRSAKRRPPR